MVSTLTCSAAFSACTSPGQTEGKRGGEEEGRRGGGEECVRSDGGVQERGKDRKEGKDQRGCTSNNYVHYSITAEVSCWF